MIYFGSLVSGSSGNASVISDGKTTILTDCGVSGKMLVQLLNEIDLTPDDIDAVLVTHEHSDHTKGLGVIARRYGFPIYISEGTFNGLTDKKIDDSLINTVSKDDDFQIGTIGIKPFQIPHDANEPLGFSFFADGKKLCIATDIGEMQDRLFKDISGSDCILLESNHDKEMLLYGPYSFDLKQRILSPTGHLSNADAADTCLKLATGNTRHIILGHLSHENNTPDIAFRTVHNTLTAEKISNITLKVSKRYSPTMEIIE